MFLDIAVVARVVREGRAPRGARVGDVVAIAGRVDVGGDVLTGEEPDGNCGGVPFCRVDAAADVVETGAEVGLVGREDAAAGVDLLAGGVGVAICRVDGARHARLLDGAAARGVEGHRIGLGAVDAFDDVDFAIRGPVGSHEPEGGPDATDTTWHMRDICQEQPLIVGFFTGDTDALAAGVGGGVVVDAHVSGVAVVADGTYHLVLHCGCVVDILHEAGGRI